MLKLNKAMLEKIESIRNNPYTEKIISVSEVEDMIPKRMSISIASGNYPVIIKFTAMQKVEVTYINTYFGERTEIIYGGFDAVQYKHDAEGMCDEYYGDDVIDIKFVGEIAKAINEHKDEELNG